MVVSLPDGETKHYSLNTDKVRIGRGTENQITIPVGCVSSRHCEISRNGDGQFLLVDLGSKNGTEVNGVQTAEGEQIVLADGDFILLGQSVYGQIVEVSSVGTVDNEDTEVGRALAELTRQSPEYPQEVGETTTKLVRKDPIDLDEEYEEISMNPVAAAVATPTRAFTSD